MICDLHYHVQKGLSADEIKDYFLLLKEQNDIEKINILSIPVSKSADFITCII